MIFLGMQLFAYSWKLPAYSGAFLLATDNFGVFAHSWSFFAYNFSFFTYSWSFFAYSGKVRLIRALRDCKQRSSSVSKKAPTVSKKAPPFSWRIFWALYLGKKSGETIRERIRRPKDKNPRNIHSAKTRAKNKFKLFNPVRCALHL